ncbi:MAG: UvrD-helicase domain-containing protein [Alphaproteobacteria bacterium]|nr:UvrD-helicase domain-containing protein [Alphaproteobacteria bacterium]
MIKKDTLSPEQEFAAEPTRNVWVQANAGTGKTSVLIERLLRILFRDNSPSSGILCLTYTNAAAGEMRGRILGALRNWAMANDDELRELLLGVSKNTAPTDADLAHARAVFFRYIDNPDLLKIKTIHGFCEEILHRFPTEAGISPSWSLISDAPQRVLLHDALDKLVNSSHNDTRVSNAFDYLVGTISEHKIDDLLKYLEQQVKHFFMVKDFVKYRNYFIDTIKKNLNLHFEKNDTYPDISVEKLKEIVEKARTEKKIGTKLKNLIELTEQYIDSSIDFEQYKHAYLTNDGTPIKTGLNYSYLADESRRVFELNVRHINEKIYYDSLALFDLSAAFAQKYRELKAVQNVLDFEDLILYTHRLFSNPETMGWILSGLDLSLSHILVDEAQDTGPIQWEILQMLAGDFFTEGDASDMPHSLFVVGDTKQSIYGFQGADANAFIKSKQEISKYIKNNVREIREVPLTQSFRSTEPILQTVDMFFGDENVAFETGFINNPHKCFRVGVPGLVEMHELVSSRDSELSTEKVRKQYVSNIADKIAMLLSTGKYKPNDFMILVRQRAPLVAPMTFALKQRGISVAGSDRIVLPEFPVIKDLMNLLRFCMNTKDDYSLCCVLKSPMFRFAENDIYKLCANRNKDKSVFGLLAEKHKDVFEILSDFIQVYNISGPYTFFSYVLNHRGMREKMVAALGVHILDPLEEFMTICLSYERTCPGTLRHFIKWFITGAAEIKRDMDSGGGVRIVTVHGSKGLQSRVVFLIDTVSMPRPVSLYNLAGDVDDLPVWLWTARAPKEYSPEFEKIKSRTTRASTEENFRLLYVAMTRARDELYIYGFSQNKNAPELSWHNMLWKTLAEKVGVTDGIIRISNAAN